MVIIEREEGPVGSWWFEDARTPARFGDPKDVEVLLGKLQSAAEILERHELLVPERVTFTGWFAVERDGKPTKVAGDDLVITIPQGAGGRAGLIASLSVQALRASVWPSGMRYPISIDVTGTGTLLLPDGKQSRADIVWLRARGSDGHVVEVRTQTDAWLPFGLDGRPQPELAVLNAARLESALYDIQTRLGVLALDGEHTEYAIMDGLRLKNMTDIDGEVIAVR